MAHLAVIDTNVLVAALLSKHSDAATVQVMARLFEGEIIPMTFPWGKREGDVK